MTRGLIGLMPDGARRSKAGPGEVADVPDNPEYVRVLDEDGHVEGYLVRWGDHAWLWTDVDSTYYAAGDATDD